MLQPKGQLLLKADLVKIPFEPKTNDFFCWHANDPLFFFKGWVLSVSDPVRNSRSRS